MALDAGFVAAVLEGIEGTLSELIDRVEDSELQANLELLQSRVTAVRVSIIRPMHEVEEPVPMESVILSDGECGFFDPPGKVHLRSAARR